MVYIEMNGLLLALAFQTIVSITTSSLVNSSSECPLSGTYSKTIVVKVTPSTSAQIRFLTELCTDSCQCHLWDTDPLSVNKTFTYLLSAKAFALVKKLAPSGVDVETEDLGPIIEAAPKQVATYSTSAAYEEKAEYVVDDEFYNNFYSLDALHDKWRALVNIHHPNVSIEQFGETMEGRPMYVLRVGKTDEKEPRRLLLNALQHAREWATVPTATFVVEKLAISLVTGERLLPPGVQALVVPISNPDGYAYTASNDRLWRKNRRPGTPCFGVDLNRNWDADFGGPFSTSLDPCSNEYVGPAPFSEAETAALRNLINSNAGIRAHVDLHAYGQDVLGAWEYTSTPPPHAHLIDQVGLSVTRAISNARSNEYRFSRGASHSLLYPASGFMSDWTYSQGIMSFTIEVRPLSGDDIVAGFLSSLDDIRPTCDEIFAGICTFLEYAKTAPANLTTLPSAAPIVAFPKYPNSTSKTVFKSVLEYSVESLLGIGFLMILVVSALLWYSHAHGHKQQLKREERSLLSTSF